MAETLAMHGGKPVRTEPFPAWPIFGDVEERRLIAALRSGKWGKIDGSEVTEFTNEIVRPYPQRIAGEPVAFGFEPETKIFTLTYHRVEGVSGPTEIFIPETRHYPGGFQVRVTGRDQQTQWDGRVLKVFHDPDEPTHAIFIEPRS